MTSNLDRLEDIIFDYFAIPQYITDDEEQIMKEEIANFIKIFERFERRQSIQEYNDLLDKMKYAPARQIFESNEL